MSDFRNAELRRLDLTLLLIFLGLLRYRKASLVAVDLGLTHSAISQALRRLRDVFGDPLFLRRPHGMDPTATALALEAPVAAAVEALRGALGTARAFDPATARGVVRICALDSEQAGILPGLAADLRGRAPGLDLSVLPLGRRAAIDALAEGRADLALGFLWDLPDSMAAETLYREGFLVAGLPVILPEAPSLALADYVAADHILVSTVGDLRGVVDETLETAGHTRRVVLALPGFLPALAAAAATGALVTLPSRIARGFAPGLGLVTAAPPLAIRDFPVMAVWHRRNDRDPRGLWLRDRLRSLCA